MVRPLVDVLPPAYRLRADMFYKRLLRKKLATRRAVQFKYFLQNLALDLSLDNTLIGPSIDYSFSKQFYPFACASNLTPGYFKVVKMGFGGILEEIKSALAEAKNSNREYLFAMLISCEAAIAFSRALADKARKMCEKEKDIAKKALYLEKCRIMERVPINPAATFAEAMQSLWIVQSLVWMEGNHYMGLGRLDQELYPYYARDIEQKRLTEEQAYSIILDFFRQLDAEVSHRTHDIFGDTGQTIVVGGLDSTGQDSTNDLTYMFIRARQECRGLDPKILVRVHGNSPEKLLGEACRLSSAGMGYPTFCNDEVIIKSLVNCGYALEDARNYTVGGCWEPIIPGKSYDIPNTGKVVFIACLESVMNKGRSMIDQKRKIGISQQSLAQYQSYDQLKEALKKEICEKIQAIADYDRQVYRHAYAHSPLLSATLEGCIEHGLDLTEGGAKYNNWGILGASLADCADAMYVLKKVVFEDKLVSAGDFLQMMRSNYEGKENWRQRFINRFPKFCNDDDEVDRIAVEIAEYFCDRVKETTNIYGNPFKPALASESGYIETSRQIGASPNGRKAGAPYGVNLSSSLAMDRSGPTAVLRSVTKINLLKACDGAVVDIKFHPGTLSNADGIEKFMALIKGFVKLGGFQLQCNVVSRDMLLDAQKNPEKYPDLIVRVWGFSSYFVRLPKEYQDHIIARTEN